MGDALCDECREHFAAVRTYLDAVGVKYTLVPTLVRGLDYYTRTAFEFVDEAIGAQSSIAGGGRYDYLAEELGGLPTPGIGFGAGIERLLLSLEEERVAAAETTEIFFVLDDGARREDILALMAKLRREGRSVDTDYAGRSVKGQLTQAHRVGAETVVIADADGFTVRRRGEEDRRVQELEL
jgi:histidyl-tRNA synthetase